ncbi:MAG: type II toxin-antitoxin system HicB family antitoxin [Fimbriimonadaceae bacterium]|nr:type II toxin-antitoxin system HicB family antitoxin [Fimbriimonadaceae bacterium]NUM37659.1 type II toxin-antitoxin system HicB family antitoxin [Armatimonadota bacterium]
MEWRIVLEQDKRTGDWAVWCPELPGCVSAGRTPLEAESNIQDAIRLYLQPMPLKLELGAVLKKVAVP